MDDNEVIGTGIARRHVPPHDACAFTYSDSYMVWMRFSTRTKPPNRRNPIYCMR